MSRLRKDPYIGILSSICLGFCLATQCFAGEISANQTAQLVVNASDGSGRHIPETLFGIFFEEINHAGAGGLWAELVSNRGFEAGGESDPSNIDPWSIIGGQPHLNVSTERSSGFARNKQALRMDIFCGTTGDNICPDGGVGVYNPGFWGMNIVKGKKYKVVFYVKSSGPLNLSVSFTGSSGKPTLASVHVQASAAKVSKWRRVEFFLEAKDTNHNSRLQLTTAQKGVLWLDQVSAIPVDTYKGHGFRADLVEMMKALKPRFIRFPGGCFVEGEWLRNAVRWKETVGPWEERPGHFGDIWKYWTDDGIGHYEFFLLAEDIGAAPIWVVNNGVSHNDEVATPDIEPFVQEALDGIEFARGSKDSKWGALRASMGHPEPFELKYVAVGNEDCGKTYYLGNYLKFYNAIKKAYPDIEVISNCDGSSQKLDHPADIYDFHIYTTASDMFSRYHNFDKTSRSGPKAFVSEYAVTGKDAGNGSLLAALGEAAFLLGIEKNSDVVSMASYAPLFVHTNDRKWNPDAIVFNSSHAYGTPSYWMQQLFAESSGATLLDTTLQSGSYGSLVATAISWKSSDGKNYITIKAVNFGSSSIQLKISVDGLDPKSLSGSSKTVLTSSNVMDENSFAQPRKIVPVRSKLEAAGNHVDVTLSPHSFTSIDLLKQSSGTKVTASDSSSRSSIL